MIFQLNGRTVDYAESGAGPCVVFVPGSFSATAAWRPISDHLGARYRSVATSLAGCGKTEELRTEENTSADILAELVEAVIERTGVPVHLAGHSWGAVVATAVALRGKAKLKSLILIEANMCDLLRQNGDQSLYDAAREMSDAYIRAYHAGEPEAARRVIDFWTGAGTFDKLPPKMREFAVQTTPANVLDWPAMFAFRNPIADYATLKIPALVICGTDSHPSLHRISELLAAHIPVAKLEKIPGASHLLIGTHPQEIAGLIAAHVARVEGAN
jgi:pimeloyl-ACP methyl ester carboxylesterase